MRSEESRKAVTKDRVRIIPEVIGSVRKDVGFKGIPNPCPFGEGFFQYTFPLFSKQKHN